MTDTGATMASKAPFRREDAERLSATVAELAPNAGSCGEMELDTLQGALHGALVGLLGIADSTSRNELEAIYRALQRTLIRIVSAETVHAPAYYAGQLSLLLELADSLRREAIPAHVTAILVRSDLARLVARFILDHGSTSPAELAERTGRAASNLVPVVSKLQAAGLVRRETFGRRVRLLPTALLRGVAAQKVLDDVQTPAPKAAAAARDTSADGDSLTVVRERIRSALANPTKAKIAAGADSERVAKTKGVADRQIADVVRPYRLKPGQTASKSL